MNGEKMQTDALISIESTAEWQIHDILYDGQERYVAPLTFSDYVAKYARKVDWRKLVGSETSADDYNEEDDQETAAESIDRRRQSTTNENELQKLLSSGGGGGAMSTIGEVGRGEQQSMELDEDATFGESINQQEDEEATSTTESTSQQGVGPWDSVAKRLMQSMTEMNVLLDAIQVARNGRYLVLDPVQQELLEQPKNAVLAAKKKALTSANALLTLLADQMRMKTTPSSPSATQQPQQLDPELEELMEMRKHWRLKKVGNTIVGDLSYFAVGKYRPNATFEVKKAEKQTSMIAGVQTNRVGQSWRVILPKDLEESLRLRIVIESSAGVTGQCVYIGAKASASSSSIPSIRNGQDGGGWQDKLQSAQRTLFCRDLFAQLAREAAHVTSICCAIRGRSIIIRLPYEHSMSFCLEPYSADGEDLNETSTSTSTVSESSFVLEHNLNQLFDSELDGSNRVIIPRPVAAPLTHLSKKARLAGPDALPMNALAVDTDSDKLLVQRILDQTAHFLFYRRAKEVIDKFATTCQDPTILVHWCPETTGIWSLVRIQMMTPYYDACGRTLIMLEIGIDSIKATLRDGEIVSLSSNLQELEHFLKLRARQHIVSAVGTLARPQQWHTLYSNPCQVDKETRELAPAIMVGHQAGTSAVCVRYPLEGEPKILVQSSSSKEKRFVSDLLTTNVDEKCAQLWKCMRNNLREIDYRRLPGTNFLHKIELLIATLN